MLVYIYFNFDFVDGLGHFLLNSLRQWNHKMGRSFMYRINTDNGVFEPDMA
jgi:hypothetical protein